MKICITTNDDNQMIINGGDNITCNIISIWYDYFEFEFLLKKNIHAALCCGSQLPLISARITHQSSTSSVLSVARDT